MRGDQQRHRACLTDGHGGLHVALEEQALDGDAVRVVLGNKTVEGGLELGEALRIGLRGPGSNHARVQQSQPIRLERDDAKPKRCGAGIDAERDHRAILVGTGASGAARRRTPRAAP